MNQQRKIIYGVRQQILELVARKGESGEGIKGEILDKVRKEIQAIVMVNSQDSVDLDKIIDQFSLIVPFDDTSKKQILAQIKQIDDATKIEDFLVKLAEDLYEQKEKQVGAEGTRLIETMIYLQTMDELWVEHLDTVDDLRSGINLRAYAQRDPLVEYKKEAFDLFDKLMQNIDSQIVHRIYKVSVPNAQPIQVTPVMKEQHEEALDLDQFVADLESEIETSPDAKVKIERPEGNTPVVDRSAVELAPATKVMIERPGQAPIEQVLSESGNAVNAHPKLGRNDECWCGSGKKYCNQS
jgi:preprotein translocase subunit SecA